MHRPDLPIRVIAAVGLVVLVGVLTYPLAYTVTHGINPAGWPGLMSPRDYLNLISAGDLGVVPLAWKAMVTGGALALPSGGVWWGITVGPATLVASTRIVLAAPRVPRRVPDGPHGNAKWAMKKDMKSLNRGVEIGFDPKTRRPIRINVEGNLLTIAPPRSGKTAGLVLPNLAFSEPGAFGGPVVVIDPKGDAYRSACERREALGRTVRCIDPFSLAGGTDRWNPLLHRQQGEVIDLLAVGRALLPGTPHDSAGSVYFQDQASTLIAAALNWAVLERRNIAQAARLVSDPDRFRQALAQRREPLSTAALSILDFDPKTRDPILSTAGQALQWLLDPRMQNVVSDHTFDMADLKRGDVDLFIVLPADNRRENLAPFTRWLLSDLFEVVRRKPRASERILLIIDEAFVLGRFDAILKGVGELPGFGVSTWTFWQSRQQMVETYGDAGASILIDTAEVVSIAGVSRANVEESARWSKAIGSFTAPVQTISRDARSPKPGTSDQPTSVDLVAPSDLAALTQNRSLVFLNGKGLTRDPLLLGRTLAWKDRRFTGLLKSVPPVGPSQS